MQLSVTLPISGTLDSNIHAKTYSDKAICKNHETFTTKQKQFYGILGLQGYFDNPEMHPLVRYTNRTKVSWDSKHSRDLPWQRVLLMEKYPKNYQVKFHTY